MTLYIKQICTRLLLFNPFIDLVAIFKDFGRMLSFSFLIQRIVLLLPRPGSCNPNCDKMMMELEEFYQLRCLQKQACLVYTFAKSLNDYDKIHKRRRILVHCLDSSCNLRWWQLQRMLGIFIHQQSHQYSTSRGKF